MYISLQVKKKLLEPNTYMHTSVGEIGVEHTVSRLLSIPWPDLAVLSILLKVLRGHSEGHMGLLCCLIPQPGNPTTSKVLSEIVALTALEALGRRPACTHEHWLGHEHGRRCWWSS
jgi:hypothetical protein